MTDNDKTAATPAVPDKAPPAPPKAPGWHWVYEAPVFYGALMALQRLAFPEDPSFLSVDPSPFWLGLLLFGLRYGLSAGLYAGALSAGLYAFGVKASGEGFRFEDTDFYVRPGLFLLFGAGIGGAADSFRHRIAELRDHIADLTAREQGLTTQVISQQKAMRAIEQQVVSQMSSVVTLYQGSRRLGALDRTQLFEAVLDFFTRALQASKTALYVPRDGRWVLAGKRGWKDAERYPVELAAGEGIVGMAAAQKKPASLRDWLVGSFETGAEVPAEADAIMAAPILDPDGEPAAVFAVESMPFLRFNSASLNLLTLLADWGGEAYGKCLQVEELRARSVLDEDFGVHSPGYFAGRLRQEFKRSARQALPFSLLLVRPAPAPDDDAPRRRKYLHALCRVLRESIREEDILARVDDPQAYFAVILQTTVRERAEEVRARVLASFDRLGLPAGMGIGVGSYAHTMTGPKEVLDQARDDIR